MKIFLYHYNGAVSILENKNLINHAAGNQLVFHKIMKMRLDKPIFTTVIKYMATLESFKDQDPRVILLIRCLRNSIIPSFITNRVDDD
ncbi:hypothetical protein ACOME3_008544 [Neoechinorhynchus agilis]